MIVLGIETSCDETSAAIVKDGRKILSNITATSAGIHARTGGVIPENAARKQIEAIIPTISLALEEATLKKNNIDAIAITNGPGLIGSLLVGVETAKALALSWDKPVIPVNHLAAHLYANWLLPNTLPEFPALGLVVSGGHTDLVLLKDHNKISLLGSTRDDAAGEAFDKTARLLGLPYPGGPEIANLADNFRKDNPEIELSMFPRPMIDSKDFDFSFSGLKTAVLNKINALTSEQSSSENPKLSEYDTFSKNKGVQESVDRFAAEIQEAVVDVLVKKTLRAVQRHKPRSLLLAGGVAANSRLREKFLSEIKAKKLEVALHVPNPKLCTDNASYIASFAEFNNSPLPWQKVSANPQLVVTD